MSNRLIYDPGDTNELLMLEIIKYFKANERWETQEADRPGVDARNALANIRFLAKKRRMEIQGQRKERTKKVKNERGKPDQ